jgi:hypothetical protein
MGDIGNAINTLLTLSWVEDMKQKLDAKGMPGWIVIGIGVAVLLLIYKMF